MRSKDTEKMQKIIDFVDTKYFEENYVPTMQEIADEMCMTKSNVSGYVKEMAEKGMLVINNRWRGICTNKIQKTLGSISRVPIVGTIACGTPMLAEENIENYIIPTDSILPFESIFPNDSESFKLFNGLPVPSLKADGVYKIYKNGSFYGLAEVKQSLLKVRTKLC